MYTRSSSKMRNLFYLIITLSILVHSSLSLTDEEAGGYGLLQVTLPLMETNSNDNDDIIEEWLRTSLRMGYVNSGIRLGEWLIRQPERASEGVEMLQGLVNTEEGAEAAYLLSICLERGMGTEQNLPEALRWLTKASDQGLPYAQYALGSKLYKATGIVKDLRRAEDLLVQAAVRGGHGRAAYALGVGYAKGDFGEQVNFTAAVAWYRMAAERNVPHAQLALGQFYEHGMAVEKDEMRAAALYQMAAKSLKEAQFALDSLMQRAHHLVPDLAVGQKDPRQERPTTSDSPSLPLTTLAPTRKTSRVEWVAFVVVVVGCSMVAWWNRPQQRRRKRRKRPKFRPIE